MLPTVVDTSPRHNIAEWHALAAAAMPGYAVTVARVWGLDTPANLLIDVAARRVTVYVDALAPSLVVRAGLSRLLTHAPRQECP